MTEEEFWQLNSMTPKALDGIGNSDEDRTYYLLWYGIAHLSMWTTFGARARASWHIFWRMIGTWFRGSRPWARALLFNIHVTSEINKKAHAEFKISVTAKTVCFTCVFSFLAAPSSPRSGHPLQDTYLALNELQERRLLFHSFFHS